ncbi:hypothetical protein GCM10023325_19810 [Sphingomonas lutea]
MRRGNGDADPSEAARPDTDEDRLRAALAQHVRNHRYQPFGMAASQDFVPACDARPRPVEQGGGASSGRRVEREDHNEQIVVTSSEWPQVPKVKGSRKAA